MERVFFFQNGNALKKIKFRAFLATNSQFFKLQNITLRRFHFDALRKPKLFGIIYSAYTIRFTYLSLKICLGFVISN